MDRCSALLRRTSVPEFSAVKGQEGTEHRGRHDERGPGLYIQWMRRHRWGFDQDCSELDPNVNLAESKVYFINMVYSRGEGTSVGIRVMPHPPGNQGNGKNVEVWILDPPEEPCT